MPREPCGPRRTSPLGIWEVHMVHYTTIVTKTNFADLMFTDGQLRPRSRTESVDLFASWTRLRLDGFADKEIKRGR